MPWTCPACNIQIQHEQDRPLPRNVYRCHVCRLELVVDERGDQLVVAPFPEPHLINPLLVRHPWTCPACDHPVRPPHGFPAFAHVVYRCKLCGLELALDKKTNTLIAGATSTHAHGNPDEPL